MNTKKSGMVMNKETKAAPNSTFAIGGVSCSVDCFAVKESAVLRNPPLRQHANRQDVKKPKKCSKMPLKGLVAFGVVV